jgi:tetratricopeptide (TPR) repeat protein
MCSNRKRNLDRLEGPWRISPRDSAPQQLRRTLLWGLVIILMSHGGIHAQPSAFEQWPQADREWTTGGRGPSYLDIYGGNTFGSGQDFVARPAVSSIVTLHQLQHHVPRRAAKEYERALRAQRKGDDEEAIGYFKKAITLDSEFCEAINSLGVTYLRLNSVELATEQFTSALVIDPHALAPYSNLALAYLRQGRFTDGERTARRAVDVGRGDAYSHLILGIALVLQGHFTAAARRSLTRASGEYALGNFWLAVGLMETGDFASAKDQLKIYLANAPTVGTEIARTLMQEIESIAQEK